MKGLLKLSFGLLASVSMLVSCAENDIDNVSPIADANTITFSSKINEAATRAAGNYFEDSDQISVTAYTASGELYAENVNYTYIESLFTSDDPICLSYDCTALSYWAVYPYCTVNDHSVIFNIQEDQSADGAYTSSDLMSSYVSTTTVSSPSLYFNHLLTKIVINISTNSLNLANAQATIYSPKSVDFDLATGNYDTSDDTTKITMSDNGTNSFKAIVVPSDIAIGDTFALIEIDGEEYDIPSPSECNFASGCQYTFNISLSQNSNTGEVEVSFGDALIGDWESDDDDIASDDYDGTWSLVVADDGSTTGLWYEGLMNSLWGYSNKATKSVEIYESDQTPGLYRIENIYTGDFTSILWGCSEEEEVGYAIDPTTQTIYTYIHAEDPSKVWIEFHDSGYFINDTYGYFWYGSFVPENDEATGESGSTANYGTLADNVIYFPTSTAIIKLSNHYFDSDFWSSDGSSITLVLPGGEMPQAEIESISYDGVTPSDDGINYNVTFSVETNQFTEYVKCIVGRVDGDVDVEDWANGIIAGTYYSTTLADNTLTMQLGDDGSYTIVAVPFNADGVAGEYKSYTVEIASRSSEGTLSAGSYILNGYSYFDGAWAAESTISISYVDESTGELAITGLCFDETHSYPVTGYYDAFTQTISIADWQVAGEFLYNSEYYDIYFTNAENYDDIVFTRVAGSDIFTTTQWWGYYIDGLGWYDVYTTSTISLN